MGHSDNTEQSYAQPVRQRGKRASALCAMLTRISEFLPCFSSSSSSSSARKNSQSKNMGTISKSGDAGESLSQIAGATKSPSQDDKTDTDHLLVAHGLPRTRHLREKLVDENREAFEGEDIERAPLFAGLDDTEFIFALNAAFSDEFEYLTSADAKTVEQGSHAVVGGYGPNKDKSPSQLLYNGEFHSEVDRTIVGILAMKWILTNDYDTFAGRQAPPIRLSKACFDAMRRIFIDTLRNSRGSYILIVSMIVNDLGKNSSLRMKIKDVDPNWEVINHDQVIYRAAQHHKLELVNEFDQEDRKLLLKGIQFGGMLNLGQLAQGENVPGSLKEVAPLMEDDKDAFPMKFCEIVLDVAGASGHIDSRGANAWIAPVYEAYCTSRECVLAVILKQKTIREAYDGVLEQRAELLASKGFRKLSVLNAEERSILRLITMARASNKAAAEAVEVAVNMLRSSPFGAPTNDLLGHPINDVREALLNGLDVDGDTDGVAIIPYYAPGMLAEAARVTREAAKKEREQGREVDEQKMQANAMAGIFRFLARIFLHTRPIPGEGGVVLECDISFIQENVRGPEFLKDPKCLDDVPFSVKKCYNQDINSSRIQDLLRKARMRRSKRQMTNS